jgi:transcription-repair coupling factor (superfamily II helicase)
VTQVVAAGEYSVRGGLIDLFPMGTPLPYRIDLFDDEVETIRTFDVDTSARLYPVPEIRLLPAREFPARRQAGRTHLSASASARPSRATSRVGLYKDVSNGIAAGRHRVLPAAVLRRHRDAVRLPARRTCRCCCTATCRRDRRVLEDTQARATRCSAATAAAGAAARQLFLRDEEFFVAAKACRNCFCRRRSGAEAAGGGAPLPALAVERKADDPLHKLRAFLAGFDGRVLLLAESPGRRETLADYLAEYGLQARGLRRLRRLPRRRCALRSASARSPAASCCPTRGSPSSPRTSSTPPPPARAGRDRCAPRQPRRLAARPVRAQGRRPGGA